MLCLVTGAAGFIGSSLCDRLLAEGHQVRAIDSFVEYYPRAVKLRNISRARDHKAFEFLSEDLVTTDMARLLDGVEWVFHQAAQAGVRASWGKYFDTYVNNNIVATQRLLEAARSSTSLKKIVYASSSSVYGNAETFPTSERVLPQPVSPYGVSKLAAEHMMSLYAVEAGLPTVSLRYFTVFGPRQRPDMAFNRFLRAALCGQELVVYGDGQQTRDFTYVGDIVDANLLAARHAGAGRIYNIGGGPHASVNEVLGVLEKIAGSLRVRREERQRGDARHTCADISLAAQELNFAPRVSIEEGLKHEMTWLEQELKAQ